MNDSLWFCGFVGWELALFASVLAQSLMNQSQSSSLDSSDYLELPPRNLSTVRELNQRILGGGRKMKEYRAPYVGPNYFQLMGRERKPTARRL